MESVLLMGGIYEVYCWDDLRWHNFMKLGANVQKLSEWGIHIQTAKLAYESNSVFPKQGK
jgi:hypothetical protein